MTHFIRKAWRPSLAAVVLLSVLGWARNPASAERPLAGSVDKLIAQKEREKPSKEARADKEVSQDVERARAKERLKNLEREIDELRAAGKLEAAEKLTAEFKELAASLVDKDRKTTDKEGKHSKPMGELDELRARLKELEIENARLREQVAGKHVKEDNGKGLHGKTTEQPDRKKPVEIQEKLKAIEGEIAALRKAGREPEAEKLEGFAAELRGHLKAYGSKESVKEKHAATDDPRERLEQLKRMIEKLQATGQKEQAEKLTQEAHKLAAALEKTPHQEQIQKGHEGHPSAAHIEKIGRVLAELREDVNRLRDEMAELRRMIKEK